MISRKDFFLILRKSLLHIFYYSLIGKNILLSFFNLNFEPTECEKIVSFTRDY